MTHNNESSNTGWIFLAGLATGAVVGYLLNTDRGRELRTEAATKATVYGEQARSAAMDKWSTAASTVNSIVEKGKAYASDVSTKLSERLSSTSASMQNAGETAESAYQKGANKAKARVNELSSSAS